MKAEKIDTFMFIAGLIYLILHSIPSIVMCCQRGTLKKHHRKMWLSILPHGHTKKGKKKKQKPSHVVLSESMLSPWLTCLFSFLLSSCLLGRYCGHFHQKVSLNKFPLFLQTMHVYFVGLWEMSSLMPHSRTCSFCIALPLNLLSKPSIGWI